MFQVVKVNAQMFEYIHDSTFKVTIPCKNYAPVISNVSIARLDVARTVAKDDYPKLTAFFLEHATDVLDEKEDNSVPKVCTST